MNTRFGCDLDVTGIGMGVRRGLHIRPIRLLTQIKNSIGPACVRFGKREHAGVWNHYTLLASIAANIENRHSLRIMMR